jgi:hypothetical protein
MPPYVKKNIFNWSIKRTQMQVNFLLSLEQTSMDHLGKAIKGLI